MPEWKHNHNGFWNPVGVINSTANNVAWMVSNKNLIYPSCFTNVTIENEIEWKQAKIVYRIAVQKQCFEKCVLKTARHPCSNLGEYIKSDHTGIIVVKQTQVFNKSIPFQNLLTSDGKIEEAIRYQSKNDTGHYLEEKNGTYLQQWPTIIEE